MIKKQWPMVPKYKRLHKALKNLKLLGSDNTKEIKMVKLFSITFMFI
jgi:hypothetical protein